MTVLSSAVGNVGNQPMKKSVFIKAARLRAGAAAGSVVDPERIKVTPNEQGVLVTPDLQPGPAVISWDTHNYHVTIPASGTVSWWSVIALAVGVPPNTSEEAIAEALQVYLDANPIEGGGLSVEQIAAAADDPASPLGQTLAERYAPLWQASTAYAINAPVVLPNGTLGKRTTAGTSRATFDATEVALWTVASGGSSGAGLTDDGTGLFTISSGSSITEDSSNPGLFLIGA